MRFEVSFMFWLVTSCSLVGAWRFGGNFFLRTEDVRREQIFSQRPTRLRGVTCQTATLYTVLNLSFSGGQVKFCINKLKLIFV